MIRREVSCRCQDSCPHEIVITMTSSHKIMFEDIGEGVYSSNEVIAAIQEMKRELSD